LEERLIAKVRTEQEEEEEERCHGVAIDAGSQSPSTSFMGAFWRIMQCPISALSKRSSGFHFHVNLTATSGPFSSELSNSLPHWRSHCGKGVVRWNMRNQNIGSYHRKWTAGKIAHIT